MPRYLRSSVRFQALHHTNVNAILSQGDDAIRRAKALGDNYSAMVAHVAKLAEFAGGQERQAPKADPRLHVMLAEMERLGRIIYRAPTLNLSRTEIRNHHRHLSAVLPLLKENAEHAAVLSKYWTKMHKQLSALVAAFPR
jgi:hypothetical protein